MAPGSEDMSWGLGAPESGELAAMFMPWFIMFMLAAAGDLDEAVVEGEAVADRVLPALLVLAVEGEEVHDELVDLAQRAHLARVVLDGHRDERDV